MSGGTVPGDRANEHGNEQVLNTEVEGEILYPGDELDGGLDAVLGAWEQDDLDEYEQVLDKIDQAERDALLESSHLRFC